MIRTSRKPRACAARRYSSTTDGTSRGRKEWRSRLSSIGSSTGSSPLSRLQPRAGHHVLLPVLECQEILPCKLALSERGGALEEGDVDDADVLGAGRLGDLLGDHLPHERDRDATQAMQDLVGAADPCPGKHRPRSEEHTS